MIAPDSPIKMCIVQSYLVGTAYTYLESFPGPVSESLQAVEPALA